jgi:hypothetical protein
MSASAQRWRPLVADTLKDVHSMVQLTRPESQMQMHAQASGAVLERRLLPMCHPQLDGSLINWELANEGESQRCSLAEIF